MGDLARGSEAVAGVIVAMELELVFGQDMKTGGVDKELEFPQLLKRSRFGIPSGGSGNILRTLSYENGSSLL